MPGLLQRIRILENAVRQNTPVSGEGTLVSRGLHGTVIEGDVDGQDTRQGMFALLPVPDDPSKVLLTDSSVEPEYAADGKARAPYAGIAHVNDQPFEVKRKVFSFAAKTGERYVYLKFTAPDGGNAEVGVEPVVETKLQTSDPKTAWYLLGRVRPKVVSGKIEEMEISQDHLPGNCYFWWFGPCIGLLEEQTFYER